MPELEGITAVDTSVDTSAADNATVETSTNASTDNADASQQDQQQATDQQTVDTDQQTTDTTPGEQLSPAVKSAIEKLKAENPAFAKEIRNMFHREQAFLKEFPGGFKDAVALKQTFEQFGGADGVKALAGEKQEWDSIDQKFANGDASVLDTFIANSPEGFVKLAPAVLTALNKQSPETYNHVMGGVFAATLDGWKFSESLSQMFDSLSKVVDEHGQPLCTAEMQELQRLYKQYEGIKELASKAPVKQVDPEREKLEADKKAFETQKQQAHAQEVLGKLNSHASDVSAKALDAELSARKWNIDKSDPDYGIITKEVINKTVELMNANPEIAKKLSAMEKIRESETVISFVNSNFDKYLPEAVKFVMRRYEKLSGTGKKPVQSAKPAEKVGPQALKEAPAQDKIDWTRTSRQMAMNGSAYLKGEKNLYTWM